MGTKENDFVRYFGLNHNFANLFNGYFFDGDPYFKTKNLGDHNGTYRKPNDKNDQSQTSESQKQTYIRDVTKIYRTESGDEILLCVLGIEHMSYVDLSMPVRVMEYDASELMDQIRILREDTLLKYPSRSDKYWDDKEYFSRLQPGQTLIPVITLVVYLGEKEWKGPMNVHDMFGHYPKELEPLIPSYPMFLLNPQELTEQEILEYNRDTQAILTFVKHSSNRAELKQLAKDKKYSSVNYLAAGVIASALKIKIPLKEEEGGTVNMCTAVKEWEAEIRSEEKEKNRKEEDEKNFQKDLATARNMMTRFGASASEAVDTFPISGESKARLLKELQS